MTTLNLDQFRQVTNGQLTYDAIAAQLLMNGSCIVGWTDKRDSHLDILFTVSPKCYGALQGGIMGYGYLYVSIMKRSCFAFRIDYNEDRFPSYIGEKLSEPPGPSVVALTELINGVMREIRNVQ